MQKLPKIVSERLKIAGPPSAHPDADLLTAYSERALPHSERALVLDHLSYCGDCREIVALAQPEFETDSVVVLKPAHHNWFTLPALRWGFAAACAVVLVSVGVLQYQRSSHVEMAGNAENSIALEKEETLRKAQNLEKGDSENAQNLPPAAPPPAMVLPETSNRAPAAAMPFAKKSVAQNSEARDRLDEGQIKDKDEGASFHGRAFAARALSAPAQEQKTQTATGDNTNVLPYASGATIAANPQPAPAPIPQSSEMVEVQAANQAVTVNVAAAAPLVQDQVQNQITARDVQNLPVNGRSQTDLKQSSQDQSGLNVVAKSVPPTIGGPIMGSAQAAMVAPLRLPTWSLGPAGILQRSFDEGKTWQSVDVSAKPQPSTDNLLQAQVTAKAKDQNSYKLEKSRISQVIFYSVAARGPEVWAGANAGVLYYSSNAGSSWVRMQPATNGITLTGDVVRIEFTAEHGCKVSTSTTETWSTADDGQTWSKQ
jgi:hypothetical protein